MLRGRIDQARKNAQGKVFIIDLKTGYDRFAQRAAAENRKVFPVRFPMTNNYQLSAYWWLYGQVFGNVPYKVGIYHLDTGNVYLDIRTSEQVDELFAAIEKIKIAGEEENFPRFGLDTGTCRKCNYRLVCLSDEERQTIKPVNIEEIVEELPKEKDHRQLITAAAKEASAKQLPLGLRRKR